jgi:bacterioferritin-associated ferredoxin
MIICHCTGTTDRRVRHEVESGARSCAEVGRRCEAGTVCGGCTPLLECVIAGKPTLGAARQTRTRA